MALRAQLSLMFSDANLYENLIKPAKQNRELNDIIVKCLSAYYYDEEIRSKIEGIEPTRLTEDAPNVLSQQDIINDIRSILTVQDFMVQNLQSTLEDGTSDISNILNNANAKAEESGLMRTKTDETTGQVSYVPLIGTAKTEATYTSAKSGATSETVNADEQGKLQKEMSDLEQKVDSKLGEFGSQISNIQEMLTNLLSTMGSANTTQVATPPVIAEPPKIEEPAEVVEHKVGEATSALADFLGSM